MPKHLAFFLSIFLVPVLIASCGGKKTFQSKSFPDVGVTIEAAADWQMAIKGADQSAFRLKLQGQPDYVFPPVSAAKGNPLEDLVNPIPNWRFIGVKGEFDPEMNPMTGSYPRPEGLYFVGNQKGELQDERVRELPWPGAEGVQATVRLYEITHGVESLGTADLWHAYTVTFNHNGNALEFNFQVPSQADTDGWIDGFWKSITKLELK